ncbi:outer membrane protein assembly factor BamB [Curvibacter sp. HBC28]|uniref:Outer membrane protein assembly factor BamB n=1 Tax=Curvibacter microcysteis TaxID=3026419 RepID=A0ABT5MEQ4_9BURK|nr:outer membrane protein assembly factor BamB [Curvibacter sp. HBC28]MDD0814911.1 outer membrane protein assembly factor BamB [Curvibacter sp. HBC28]
MLSSRQFVTRPALTAVLAASLVFLTACSSSSGRPKPAELQPVVALVGVKPAWSAQIGALDFSAEAQVTGSVVTVASSRGQVSALDVSSGRELWRADAKGELSAGVGGDGQQAAVVTTENELVVLAAGRELWRQKLSAQVFTAPLVAGGRVFVLAADRSVQAFDGQTGRKLWSQQRPGEALVLQQPGVLMAVRDTLVVGLSSRLTGLNPSNGSIRWEAPLATPRGTNDVERLVDLVGRVSRVDDSVCARAFQAAIGCVQTNRGTVSWSKPSNGYVGVHGDAATVFSTEGDGRLVAWRRADGERLWSSDRLQYRRLTAPLLLGRSIAIGDDAGFVHLLSREDGSLLNRLSTDGSPIVVAPVLADGVLIVVTRKGGVFAFRPE